ncbi:NAD(P)-binding domain-containing protein [Alkalihalobacillus trypoxylicola]|uniref:Monooxygenase n=1 Tax=Alkalihalobacillus trypoxylicola TaxID=519424 RepID=A0A161PJH1_9BACI|nr:NAD(P)/FAD-dependent oxidoreductase [Alkalihalobacillus trypoxylicola]KYG29441.1 monooxygenase [Alkalihalobacillus trypoxylicola]
MSLKQLNEQVKRDLDYLNYDDPTWVKPRQSEQGHIFDVVIVGGGQSGLAIAFGLLKERISNILIIDENDKGQEGPWETYARMVTLRTPKHITSVDLGIPSLTFRAYWESQFGEKSWSELDKISRGDWMNYLKWYRDILSLPVQNQTKLELIEPVGDHYFALHTKNAYSKETLLTRKVVLATGIQGGGEWHTPHFISKSLPKHLYAHTSEPIDFMNLKNKKVAILGGGASAFDNANFALEQGVSEAHVFVRREQMPRINPIRKMESSGMIERFQALADEKKYEAISHFFKHNQPPTNDTFNRAKSNNGFKLHLGSPWKKVEERPDGIHIKTPKGEHLFDFLIISTGLITDPALRPELALLEHNIKRWGDVYDPPNSLKNPILDSHPYLDKGFSFQARNKHEQLSGLYAFNYSALISCGITASALSGMRYGVPRLVSAIADELFLDDEEEILTEFYQYDEEEFIGQWKAEELQS